MGLVNNLRVNTRHLFAINLHVSHLIFFDTALDIFQQKSRLGALESLRTPKSRSIVVASDVAARGLDIPSVSTVVHYDVARTIDTFIHRSGRTAVRSIDLF